MRKDWKKEIQSFPRGIRKTTRPEKQTYTDAELDEMINTIVLVYDNQFTFEEANKSLEDVSEIIFNFGLINANILKKFKDEAAGAKKFKLTGVIDYYLECEEGDKRLYRITTYAYRRFIKLMEKN